MLIRESFDVKFDVLGLMQKVKYIFISEQQ